MSMEGAYRHRGSSFADYAVDMSGVGRMTRGLRCDRSVEEGDMNNSAWKLVVDPDLKRRQFDGGGLVFV